jgi:mannose-6-phosphate isomerase-like protein (cupin superfamily)
MQVNCCQPGQRYDCTNLEAAKYNIPGEAYEPEPLARLPVGRFDRELLRDVDTIVRAGGRPPMRPGGGAGKVFAREMWGERDFRSCFRYLRQYALPPLATMGPYRRGMVEECFFIISGSGVISVAGEAVTVVAGDIVFAGLGETRHLAGSANQGTAELVLWNLGVAMDHDVDEATDCTTCILAT